MTSPDPWHRIHAERLHLAEVLRALPATSWGASTLCDAWSVRDVVAHLTAAASTPTLPWLANMLATRFDTDLHNQRLLLRHRGMDDVETLDRFESAVTARRAPFGVVEGALGEVLVHGQDIAVPLGLPSPPRARRPGRSPSSSPARTSRSTATPSCAVCGSRRATTTSFSGTVRPCAARCSRWSWPWPAAPSRWMTWTGRASTCCGGVWRGAETRHRSGSAPVTDGEHGQVRDPER